MLIEEKINILLVDDRPENLLALGAILEKPDYNLIKASSGEEALKCVLYQDFAVILMDVQMPGIDGFEAASIIRERKRSRYTPIIFLTAIDKSQQRVMTGYELGAVDYLFKPIVPEILQSKVAVFVDLFKKTEELKRQASQLAVVNQQLAGAVEELEAFSYSVSHDLRAPLRTMQGFTQALLEDYGDCLDSTGREYARYITEAALQMDTLISDLLEYSRLGRTEIQLQPTNLTLVLQAVLSQLADQLQKQQAQVNVEAPLPQVMAHYTMLTQVIVNLLANAIKFVESDLQPKVRVWAEERQDWIRLWVADNGIGIALEHQERIFDVFERLHGVEVYPGTGIGLAIVHKGVERMGGQVGVESQLGQGSRFWIDLAQVKA